jgi:mono/diheme cytochrome c family protein
VPFYCQWKINDYLKIRLMISKNIQASVMTLFITLVVLVASSRLARAQDNIWKAPADADQLENPLKGNADAIKKGKVQYNKLCSICHGAKGKGDGVAAMALKPKPANFKSEQIQAQSDGALFWKMTEGRAPMAPYKESLKEEERWQLVNYIRELAK